MQFVAAAHLSPLEAAYCSVSSSPHNAILTVANLRICCRLMVLCSSPLSLCFLLPFLYFDHHRNLVLNKTCLEPATKSNIQFSPWYSISVWNSFLRPPFNFLFRFWKMQHSRSDEPTVFLLRPWLLTTRWIVKSAKDHQNQQNFIWQPSETSRYRTSISELRSYLDLETWSE